MADAETAPPEDSTGEPAAAETPIADSTVAANPLEEPLEPDGVPPAEPEPALATPSSSLDEPVKSPIMQRSLEREES